MGAGEGIQTAALHFNWCLFFFFFFFFCGRRSPAAKQGGFREAGRLISFSDQIEARVMLSEF